jgi:WhiB family transcriptional regulator, redox-sensing transcriptional regulator
VRSLRVAASWQIGIPETGQDAQASAWRFQARCADQDPDLFFPVGSGGPAMRQTLRAKAVCAQCPVRRECLEWALDTHQPHGVWGGLDEQERERLLGLDGEPFEEPMARPA